MGAPRSITTAVRRTVDAARADAAWSPAHEVTAVLAVKLAKQLQAAESTSDVVRLTRELRSLLGALPNGEPAPDPGAGGGGGDAIDAELAAIVGTGPEVGDPAHA